MKIRRTALLSTMVGIFITNAWAGNPMSEPRVRTIVDNEVSTNPDANSSITAGTGVSVTGNGTASAPYVISAGSSAPTVGSSLSSEGGVVGCTKASGGVANFIVSSSDNSTGVEWAKSANQSTETGSGGTTPPYANSYTDGATNTQAIVSQNTADTDYAAGICNNLTEGGKSDWHLPSSGELICIYNNLGAIMKGTGSTFTSASGRYWASTENPSTPSSSAAYIYISQRELRFASKGSSFGVRCVRTFTP